MGDSPKWQHGRCQSCVEKIKRKLEKPGQTFEEKTANIVWKRIKLPTARKPPMAPVKKLRPSQRRALNDVGT